MIRKTIDIDGYWEVIVYYDVDYNLFHFIDKALVQIGCSDKTIKNVYNKMSKGFAKAVTISNINNLISVVLFNAHKNVEDYINSIVHESEHIKQSILYAYNIKDEGEEPAYTVGYIAMKIMSIFYIINNNSNINNN